MFGAILTPWAGHTDASRELAEDMTAALADCGLSQKTAALEMGVHPSDLNRQMAGRDPLNLWRLTSLPGAFWVAFLARRSQRIGAALITPDQLQLLKGAAAMGPKRMAKMLVPARAERRQA